jgi:hypothetical protein
VFLGSTECRRHFPENLVPQGIQTRTPAETLAKGSQMLRGLSFSG